MADPVRCAIRFSSGNRILFRCLVKRAGPGRALAIPFTAGAHGWAGRWLVNGAPDGIVDVVLAEPVRAAVSGFPMGLKVLAVSLEDPDRFLAALGAPG